MAILLTDAEYNENKAEATQEIRKTISKARWNAGKLSVGPKTWVIVVRYLSGKYILVSRAHAEKYNPMISDMIMATMPDETADEVTRDAVKSLSKNDRILRTTMDPTKNNEMYGAH